MNHSFQPDPKRVKQRRLEVVKAAIRARDFTEAELTAEAASFISFCLNVMKNQPKNSALKEESDNV